MPSPLLLGNPATRPAPRGGFTLIEMMAVMAIIVILLSLAAPMLGSFTSVAGRKGAITTLMNTFEQARAAALQTGANVYVVLWKRKFPDRDCVMVVRDPVEWKNETAPVALTRWIQMPKGVLLYDPPSVGKTLFKGGVPNGFSVAALPASGGSSPSETQVAILKFSPMGTISAPAKDYLRVMVGEGVRGTDGNETLITPNKDLGLFDIITLRRFTGRPALETASASAL